MVVAKVYGGLGNQMFQYAAGYALARRLDTRLVLDTAWFDPEVGPALRPFELHWFGIEGGITRRDRILLRLRRAVVVTEQRFGYDIELETARGTVVLDGYWQSYKYFEGCADEIRAAFRFPELVSDEGKEVARAIEACDCSVGVHVRRGDYAANPKLRRIHGVLSPEYYANAAAQIRGKVASDVRFFVFSDDIEWCRSSLQLGSDTAFVAGGRAAPDYEDMALLARCDHHVLANSSFSWWGAWLSPRDGIVVAPRPWFTDPTLTVEALLPPTWIELDRGPAS